MKTRAAPLWFGGPAAWARRIAVATAAGLFMGVVGGFGTFGAAPLVPRTAGWLVMLWAGVLLYAPAVGWSVSTGERRGLPTWLTLPAATAVASLPMTAVAHLATQWVMGARPLQNWLLLYGEILVVAVPLIAVYVAVSRRSGLEGPAPAPAEAPEPVTPAFLDRLPPRLGRDLLCLQMEDHYVRVHTALGSDMILMRMRDAVGELDGLAGLQVHRSWWVARSAVAGHAVEGRRLALRLSNGLVAPVARAMAPTVRAAGWLGRP